MDSSKLSKRIFLENSAAKNLILNCYKVLKRTNLELGGGNCGNAAVAICDYLNKKYNIKGLQIGVLTQNISDNISEEMFINNAAEFDIHHMYVIYNTQRYDEMGRINEQYLLDLSLNQYREYNPIEYVFEYPKELDKIKKILYGTNRSISIEQFGSILEKSI